MKIRFTMRLTDNAFTLIEGRWPNREGQLWNGWCVVKDGTKRACQAAGSPEGPTFYWGH